MNVGRSLLVASGNAKKLAELRALFAATHVEVVGPREAAVSLPEVIEDAASFEGNARKKASEIARATGLRTLADDSGLEVDALDGLPGVRSARFASDAGELLEPDVDAANNRLLLRRLESVAAPQRTARFRCVLAVADPTGEVQWVEHGVVEGRLLRAPRGAGGFGYDPLFVPQGETLTMAELSPAAKARLSHRGQALRALLTRWES